MSLRIVQDEKYIGNDYWRWSAWLDGTRAELGAVRAVDWLLHPSFDPAVLRCTDASNGFRIDTSGWGTFVLKARITRRDGSQLTLRHQLTLYYPDEDDTPAEATPRSASGPPSEPADAPATDRLPTATDQASVRAMRATSSVSTNPLAPRVFLSYGTEDRREAAQLRQTLQSLGVDVVDQASVSTQVPLDIALRQLQDSASCTVAVVSSDTPSPWVAREVNASHAAGKPTLVFSREALDKVVGLDPDVRVVQADSADNSAVQRLLSDLGG